MTDTNSGMSVASIGIFLLILFAIFSRGNGGVFGGNGSGCTTSVCDDMRQNLINTASTQYKIQEDGEKTRNKIDFYAYQSERDRAAKAEMKNYFLEGQLLNANRNKEVDLALANISCNMARKPEVYTQSYTCDGTIIPK